MRQIRVIGGRQIAGFNHAQCRERSEIAAGREAEDRRRDVDLWPSGGHERLELAFDYGGIVGCPEERDAAAGLHQIDAG